MQNVQRSIQREAKSQYPVKILQFGDANFLLGFVGWMVQVANDTSGFNAGISVVRTESNNHVLDQQDGVYSVILKGIREEEYINQEYKVDSILRIVSPGEDYVAFLNEAINPDLQFIVTHTPETEFAFSDLDTSVDMLAGTFPGMLTQLLYYRYRHRVNNSLLILPTGHGLQNGTMIKTLVQKYGDHWDLPSEFSTWLSMRVTFCNTLVDRDVSGFPAKWKESVFDVPESNDDLFVEGEWFHLWVIEGPRWIEEVLPLKKAGLNVIYTDDLAPFLLRRIRILNAMETCLAFMGLLAGLQTVRETIDHPVLGRYIKRMVYDDIVPVVPGELLELEIYTEEAINRFRNPAFGHQLSSLGLNAFSRFKTCVLPTLLAQADKNGMVHDRLAFALSALIFYCRPSNTAVEMDEADCMEIVSAMGKEWGDGDPSKKGTVALCRKLLSNEQWWGSPIAAIPNLVERTGQYLYSIGKSGIVGSLKEL